MMFFKICNYPVSGDMFGTMCSSLFSIQVQKIRQSEIRQHGMKYDSISFYVHYTVHKITCI